MAAGCACVGSDVAGVAELLGGGVGHIVNARAIDDVAAAIGAYVDDADARAAARAAARARVAAHHKWSAMLQGFADVVTRVAHGSRRPQASPTSR